MSEYQNETQPSGHRPGVTFLNQPRISQDPKVQERHEERMLLAGGVAAFLAKHPLYQDREVTVQFAHDGVASLICVLTTPDAKKTVLKIPFGGRSTKSEAFAFHAWEAVGASVPHALEEGIYDETHEYLLMDFVDAPTLDKAYTAEELLGKELFVRLGEVLRTMHTAKATGYGAIGENGEPEFATFDAWCNRKKMREDVEYAVGNGLMEREDIERSQEILSAYSIEHPHTTVCHLDFATNNAFATEPPTVFDAAPEFNLPVLDVAKAVVNMIADGEEAIAQLLRGYEHASGVPLDRKTLQAAVVLMMVRKLANSHKTGGPKMEERIARNKAYLAAHRPDLTI